MLCCSQNACNQINGFDEWLLICGRAMLREQDLEEGEVLVLKDVAGFVVGADGVVAGPGSSGLGIAGCRELDPTPSQVCCTPLATTLLPEADASELSDRFAALGDPVRLRLLSLLANAAEGAVCVCDLTEPVGRSQGTVT